jgi:hypothetical protein
MEPISAGIGALGGLVGAGLNAYESGQINKANVQQQQWSAEGGYLPGLIANAKAAGINPLAVLGMHAPTSGTEVSSGAGAQVGQALSSLSQIKDPHQVAMEKLNEQLMNRQITALNGQINNSTIEAARNQYTLDYLRNNPNMRPEGVNEPTPTGTATDWMLNLPAVPGMGPFDKVHIPLPGLPAGFDPGSYNTP